MTANQKSTILYIDDDRLNLEIFEEFFKDLYDVIVLPSTENALEVLRTKTVKVLISDQCMPEETGIDFIKRINPEFPDIIKMILTAYSDLDVAMEAINKVGIYKYLLKPWDSAEVKNSIDNCIREFDLRFENKRLISELQHKNEALNEAFTKLEENEQKLHTIFFNSNDSIYILNTRKELIDANEALYKLLNIKGKDRNRENLYAMMKEKFPVLLDKPFELSTSASTSISEAEIKFAPGDSKTIELNCNRILFGDKEHILSVVRDISERRTYEKKIVEAIIKTQEEDQGKYARELHDGLGPLLSTLKMHIEWIADPLNLHNKDKIIQHSIHTIDNAIRSVKEIANNMSPHILQRFGLVNAVNAYVDYIKETAKIEFVVSSNLKERVPSNIEVVLYRIILECLNNAIKHSDAKKVILKFNKQKDGLQIAYSDNGKGFDVSKVMAEGQGMGLFNMQNRIKHIGGDFKIVSNRNIGTDINIRLDN